MASFGFTYSYPIWRILILFPVFFLFPGTFVVLFIKNRHFVHLLVSEFVIVSICVSVALTSLFGLILAEISHFSLKMLAVTMVGFTVIVIVVGLLFKKPCRVSGHHSGFKWLWGATILMLIVLSCFMFMGRFEAILTEADVSPYLTRGANLAEHGKIFLKNETMATLSSGEAVLLYGTKGANGKKEYLTGYLIRNQETGQVEARYFPLYSILIAISLRMFGLDRTLTFMNPLIAILGLLILVMLIRRLFDSKVALLTGLILVLNALMIWFARYPIPEMYTFLMIALGLFCFALYFPKGNGYWGILAALAFSLTLAAHFDMYALAPILAILVFIIFVSMLVKRMRISYLLWFAVPVLVFSFHSWLGATLFSEYYLRQVSKFSIQKYMSMIGVPKILRHNYALLIAVLLLLAVLFAYLVRFLIERGAIDELIAVIRRYWRPALAVLLVCIALFAYLILPHLQKPNESQHNEETFRTISLYLTHIGVVLFIAGLTLFVLLDLNDRTLALFIIGGFYSLILFANPWVNPLQLWANRRLIPVVLPFMVVMVAYVVVRLPGLLKDRILRYSVAGAVTAALVVMLVFTASYAATVHGVVQYDGVLESTRKIAERFRSNNNVVLFYGPYIKSYYPETLRYLFGVDALPLGTDTRQYQVFDKLVQKFRSEGKHVFLATSTHKLPYAIADQMIYPVGSQEVRFDVFRQVYGTRPTKEEKFGFSIKYYEVEEPTSRLEK